MRDKRWHFSSSGSIILVSKNYEWKHLHQLENINFYKSKINPTDVSVKLKQSDLISFKMATYPHFRFTPYLNNGIYSIEKSIA